MKNFDKKEKWITLLVAVNLILVALTIALLSYHGDLSKSLRDLKKAEVSISAHSLKELKTLKDQLNESQETINQIQKILETNNDILKTSEIYKKNLQQIEEIINRIQIKNALSEQYSQALPLAIEEFESELNSHANKFIEKLYNTNENLEANLLEWADEAEGIFDRLGSDSDRRINAYATINADLYALYGVAAKNFNDNVTDSFKKLCQRLMIQDWRPGLSVINLNFNNIQGIERILSFLENNWQTTIAWGEELASFIPYVGDAYDASKNVWDWRIKLIYQPNASSASREIQDVLTQYVRQESNRINSELEAYVENVLKNRTIGELYASYESSI